MHMLAWINKNKNRGVRFNAKGNTDPVIFTDASDKALLSSGLVQAGHAIMWMDGPLCTCSRRLQHVGGSIEANEYMAMTPALKKLVWLTQLLDELHVKYVKPLKLLGDNVQANKLCVEKMVTKGNQYILRQYHFNKEKVAHGLVTLIWVDTNRNIADIYTKPLTRQQCESLMPDLLGFGQGIQTLVNQILLMDPTCKPRVKM